MTDTQIRAALFVASHLLVFAIGWAACHFWERPATVPVTEHAMIRGPGTQAEAARSATPVAPKQQLQRGQTPQATFHAVIAGGKPVAKPGVPVEKAAPCQALLQCSAVTVDGTVVKDKDGQQDMYLSTVGQLVKEADFHPQALSVPAEHPNRASITAWAGGGWTGAYERDLWGPLFAGVQGGKLPVLGVEGGVTVGVRW